MYYSVTVSQTQCITYDLVSRGDRLLQINKEKVYLLKMKIMRVCVCETYHNPVVLASSLIQFLVPDKPGHKQHSSDSAVWNCSALHTSQTHSPCKTHEILVRAMFTLSSRNFFNNEEMSWTQHAHRSKGYQSHRAADPTLFVPRSGSM